MTNRSFDANPLGGGALHSPARSTMAPSAAIVRQPIMRRAQRRPGLLQPGLIFLFSGTAAATLAVVGYFCFTGYTNKIFPTGSLGATLIRLGILFVLAVAYARFACKPNAVRMIVLAPFLLFCGAYLTRLVDTFYLEESFYLPFDGSRILLIFVTGSVIPALALARMQGAIRDDQFRQIMPVLGIVFLIGLALNVGELLSKQELTGRASLDKINPIPMAHTAVAFIVFYVLIFLRSRRDLIEASIAAPVLAVIVLMSGSRAALAGGVLAIGFYFLLLRGSRRIWMIAAAAAMGLLLVLSLGPEHFQGISNRFESMLGDDYGDKDSSTEKHLQAWSGAYQQFLDDPIAGRHIIELSTGFYPHNVYLESLMSVGLLGSIPLLVHLLLAGRASVGIIRSSSSGLFATFIAIVFVRDAIVASSGGAIWSTASLWVTSTLAIALWYGRKLPVRHLRLHRHPLPARPPFNAAPLK